MLDIDKYNLDRGRTELRLKGRSLGVIQAIKECEEMIETAQTRTDEYQKRERSRERRERGREKDHEKRKVNKTCMYYARGPGGCRKGKDCPFLHEDMSPHPNWHYRPDRSRSRSDRRDDSFTKDDYEEAPAWARKLMRRIDDE